MLASLALMLVFVGGRLMIAARGDVSRFVVAGSTFTDPQSPPPLHVFPTSGYDGQFYWRLAVDPTNLETATAHGVQLDQPYRTSRIGYPALAWLVSGGQESNVEWALVVVNLLAVALAAWCASRLATLAGLRAVHGLLVIAASGLLMTVARDLTEVVLVAALLGGVLALRTGRPALAAVAWSLAVLSHEQSLYIVAGYGIAVVVGAVRTRKLRPVVLLPAILPVATFVGWQLIARSQVGELPITSSRDGSLGVPFVDLAQAIGHWLTGGLDRQELLVVPQLVLTIALVVVAFRRRALLAERDRWLPYALAVAALVSVSLSSNVWDGPAELRQIVLVPVFAGLIIVASGRPPSPRLASSVAVVWLLTAGLRMVAI